MFAIIGGALCITIGFIGALNFLNTVMTSMLARQKELAVLQAVGMTGKQVRKMLVFEGLLYTVGALTISFIIALVMMPLSNNVFEKMFWFYSNSFSFLSIILMLPIFIILGVLIPIIMYKQFQKKSVVERLTAVEY